MRSTVSFFTKCREFRPEIRSKTVVTRPFCRAIPRDRDGGADL
jgi:hypothetical protein